jgi:hypothetical protein
MGQVATITISGVNHSVYALTSNAVTDADGYFGARLGATQWTSAVTLTKQQALVSAARMLDRRATFTGAKTADSQALAWPRDGATKCGVAVTDGTVPDDIVLAQFELALALLVDAEIQNAANNGSNVESVKAGSAGVSFFVPTATSGDATIFPTPVMELVRCYLDSASDVTAGGPFVDGTNPDCCNERTSFGTCGGEFGLVGGL